MKPQLILMIVLGCSAAACQIHVAPDPAAGLAPPSTVSSALANESIGQLFATPDGTWAYVPKDTARTSAFKPGMLAAFGDDPEDPHNLYGVIDVAPWGVSLQRLDAEPPSDARTGALIPLGDGVTAGFCTGAGALTEAPCVVSYGAGRRWSIYPLDDAQRLIVDKGADGVLPIQLAAQVHIGELGVTTIGEVPARWVAIPTVAQVARPTRPRIAVSPTCEDIGSAGRANLHADWFKAEITPPTNNTQVSAEAVRLGADALVWCSGKDTRLAVPALFRPRIPVAGRDFDAPPLVGARIHTVSNRAAVDLLARIGAATATGDWATVDLLTERAVRTHGSAKIEAFTLDVMTAVAEARPEAATRLGQWATRHQWNQQNSAAWQLGMSRVEAALGNRKGAIARTADIVDVLDRGDIYARVFMKFFGLRPRLTAGAKGQDASDALVDAPDLQLVARAIRNADSDNFSSLRTDFEAANATMLFEAMNGSITPMRCEAKQCAADVYGRIWASGTVPPAALSEVGLIELRPRFEPTAPDNLPALDKLAVHAAVAPFLDDEDLGANEEEAATALIDWARDGCQGDTSTVRAVGANAARQLDSDHASLLRWQTSDAVANACGDFVQLVATARELGSAASGNEAPIALIEHHVATTRDDVRAVVETAAAFATEFERGARCELWTTALTVAFLRAGHANHAQHWVEQSFRCDVADRTTIDFLAAFLNFQRTSSTFANFGPGTRERLRGAIHAAPTSECIGLDPIAYDITAGLPAPTLALVDRIDIPSVDPSAELTLVTADDRMRNAREHMAATVGHLDARNFKEAAETLGHAISAFQALSHEVGIARMRWIDEALFSAQAAAIANGAAEFAQVGHAALRQRGVFSEHDDATLRAARTLLTATDAATLDPSNLPARKTLCELTPRDTHGIVLDTVDGKLQDVRNIGELEVELAPPGERPLP